MLETREDFIEYIMKTLGHDVITVNVTPDQVDFRIDDALRMFYEFHNEGSYRYFMLRELTEEEKNTGVITLPETVLSVMAIYPLDSAFGNSVNNLATYEYLQNVGSSVFNSSGVYGLGGGYFPSNGGMGYTLSNAVLTSSYLNTLTNTLQSSHQFQYLRSSNKLRIDDKSLGLEAGKKILIECYMETDEDNHIVYNNIWLRNYAVALTMRQWGYNLIKLGNVSLAAGNTIDGQAILQEANQRIQELEQELHTTWEEPLGVIMG